MELALGIILLVVAVFLVVAVLMQHGKSHNLSGTIAGGSETFFGKSKAQTIDKTLSRLTTIVAIVFVVIVVITYVIQDETDYEALLNEYISSMETAETTAAEGDVDTADTDAADEETTSADGDEADTEAPVDEGNSETEPPTDGE